MLYGKISIIRNASIRAVNEVDTLNGAEGISGKAYDLDEVFSPEVGTNNWESHMHKRASLRLLLSTNRCI